jgi:hypothetical protein
VSQNRAIDDYLQGNANYNRTNFGNAVIGLTKTRSGLAKMHKNHGGTGMKRGTANMVRLAGIEPTTLGFGGQYSIH